MNCSFNFKALTKVIKGRKAHVFEKFPVLLLYSGIKTNLKYKRKLNAFLFDSILKTIENGQY